MTSTCSIVLFSSNSRSPQMTTKRSLSSVYSNLDSITYTKRERKEPQRFVSEEKSTENNKKRRLRSSSPRIRHFKEYTLRKKETKNFKEADTDEDLESDEEEDLEDEPRRSSRKKNPLSSPSKQERSSEGKTL